MLVAPAFLPTLRAATPGTTAAVPQVPFACATVNGSTAPPVTTKPSAAQVPFVSLTVNATGMPSAPEYPTAEQLAAEAHDTDRSSAFTFVALVSSASSRALPQVPFFSSATNGSRFPLASVYEPTAAQPPAVPQDTEVTRAVPPAFSAFSPGIARAAVSCGAAAALPAA